MPYEEELEEKVPRQNTFCMLLLLMHQIMPANLQACHVAIHIKQFESTLCQIKLCNVRLTFSVLRVSKMQFHKVSEQDVLSFYTFKKSQGLNLNVLA